MNKSQKLRFGRWLRETRLQVQKTQEEVGQGADLTRQYIGKIEKGAASLKQSTVERLAGVVGKSVDEALIVAGFEGNSDSSSDAHTNPDDSLSVIFLTLSETDKTIIKNLAERLQTHSTFSKAQLLPDLDTGEEVVILDRNRGYLYTLDRQRIDGDDLAVLVATLASQGDIESEEINFEESASSNIAKVLVESG